MFQFGLGNQHAAGQPVGAALPGSAPGNNEDAVAAAAARRLDHEAIALADDLRQSPHLPLAADHAIQFRHRHAGLECERLR